VESGSLRGDGDVWKWLAAILASLLIGGLPGYVHFYLNAPSREEVGIIRDRQDNVLQRLGVLEERVTQLQRELDGLKEGR
jgi:hypothetical protein